MIALKETRHARHWTAHRDDEHVGTIWTAGEGDSFHWTTRFGSGRADTLNAASQAIDEATTCVQAKRKAR